MLANNLQQRVERTLFELLRQRIVVEGYLPDITNAIRYPTIVGQFTELAQSNWDNDIKDLVTAKNWVIEIFGTSSANSKSLKKAPRIVIVPKRIMPGDIGMGPGFSYLQLGTTDQFSKTPFPDESADMQFDIHLITCSQEQSRFCNALLAVVFGQKRYQQFFDNPNERFFMHHYNYYDVSDTNDGIEENVYSYEIKDLFLFDTSSITVTAIKEIKTELIIGYTIDNQGNEQPVYLSDNIDPLVVV